MTTPMPDACPAAGTGPIEPTSPARRPLRPAVPGEPAVGGPSRRRALVGGGTAFAVTMLGGGGAQPDSGPSGQRHRLRPDGHRPLRRAEDRGRPAAQEAAAGQRRPRRGRRPAAEAVPDTAEGLARPQDGHYDKDVKPWLGDRFGVAVLPSDPAGDVNVAVALQVKDEDKAQGRDHQADGGVRRDGSGTPTSPSATATRCSPRRARAPASTPPSTRARWPRTRRMSRT